MQVQDAKTKLIHNIFNSYVACVIPCQSIEELVQPSKILMKSITAIVMPEHRIEFIPIN